MFSEIKSTWGDNPGHIIGLYGQYTESHLEGVVNVGIITKSNTQKCNLHYDPDNLLQSVTESRNELLGYFVISMICVVGLLVFVAVIALIFVFVKMWMIRNQKDISYVGDLE